MNNDSKARNAANKVANRKKVLVASNIALWAAQGLYTVSPIDLIPDILPLIGWMDDALGLMVTLAFTLYTLNVLRKHGWAGLTPRAEGEVIDTTARPALEEKAAKPGNPVTRRDDLGIDGYEPLSLAEIKSL